MLKKMSVLQSIKHTMEELTANSILREFNANGVQVPFGNEKLLDKCVDHKVIKAALDTYCLNAYKKDWPEFYKSYALEESIYVQNNGDFKVSVGRKQISIDQQALYDLIFTFMAYPYATYHIYHNFCFLVLDNNFPGAISGNYYDFPNCIFLAMNKQGKITIEIDTYSNGTAYFNGEQWAMEFFGIFPAYGRSANALPAPPAINFNNKYPLLTNIDEYEKTLTINRFLLEVAKTNVTVPNGDKPYIKYNLDRCEILRATERYLKLGYVEQKWDKFINLYTNNAVQIQDYQKFYIGRDLIKANFLALFEQVPDAKYKFNFIFFKHNQVTIGVQLYFYSKLYQYYTIPINVQIYFNEEYKVFYEEDIVNYEYLNVLIQKYLADNSQVTPNFVKVTVDNVVYNVLANVTSNQVMGLDKYAAEISADVVKNE